MAKKAKKAGGRVARMVAAFERVVTARLTKTKKQPEKKTDGAALLKCGRRHEHRPDNWTTVFGDHEIALNIGQEDITSATQRIADDCIIARALLRSPLGPHITSAEVGTNITKVWSDETRTEVRFHTSAELGQAVRAWDKTKRWSLPDSLYWLRRYPDSLRPGYRREGLERARKSVNKKKSPSRVILKLHDLRAIVAAADKAAAQKKKKK
jgi:hypothetical protein